MRGRAHLFVVQLRYGSTHVHFRWRRSIAAVSAVAASWVACASAQAEVTGLFAWIPESGSVRIVLPELRGISRTEVVSRYLAGLSRDPEYSRLLASENGLSPSGRGFEKLADAQEASRPLIAVLANRPGHLKEGDPFLKTALASVREAGGDPLLVPFGLEASLDAADLDAFRRALVSRSGGMIALGGGDLDPALYGSKLTHARDVFGARDRAELALVRRYLDEGEGVFYGICRGHQLLGVASGMELHQDLGKDHVTLLPHSPGAGAATDRSHRSVWHPVRAEEGSFLREASGTGRFEVNSRHHQAVRFSPGKGLRVAALGEDGVVEALQREDGRAFSTQFHPEDMNTDEGRRILRWIVRRAEAAQAGIAARAGARTGAKALSREPDLPANSRAGICGGAFGALR